MTGSLAFQFRQNKGVKGGSRPDWAIRLARLGNPAGELLLHTVWSPKHGHSIVLPPAALGD